MNVLKYLIVSTILVVLVGCAEPSANANANDGDGDGDGDVAVQANADIKCIQQRLNSFDYNAGPENGVDNEVLRDAIELYEGAVDIKFPALTERTAPGICDALGNRYNTFIVTIEGESGIDLEFQFYETTDVNEQAEPFARVEITATGQPQRILIGSRLVRQVRRYCVYAPTGYGFYDRTGETLYAGSCRDYPAYQPGESTGLYIFFKTTLSKSG